MVTLDDMNFATGALIIALIIGIIISPIAIIISAIIFGIRKRKHQDKSFWDILWPILSTGAGALTAVFVVYSIVIRFIGN